MTGTLGIKDKSAPTKTIPVKDPKNMGARRATILQIQDQGVEHVPL
jgi:hypothetical protein